MSSQGQGRGRGRGGRDGGRGQGYGGGRGRDGGGRGGRDGGGRDGGRGQEQPSRPHHTSTTSAPMPTQPTQSRPIQSMPQGSGMATVPSVASSSRVPTNEFSNLSIGTTTTQVTSVVPNQAQPPIQKNTQKDVVASALSSSSLFNKCDKPPPRPGFGTIGRKVMVTANHFLVQLGDKNPHQYDVTITPEVTSKIKCKDIMKCLTQQYQASHLGNRLLAYDGTKSAFVAGPLPFDNKEFVIIVPEKNGREREFKVTFKFAATKDIDHLRQFLGGRQDDNPQETIQALDIVLREAASHGKLIVGRSIFGPTFEMGPLGYGIDYWRGFYQSLRPTQQGLSLNLDMSARAFYSSMLVSDFIMDFLDKDVTRPLSEQERLKVKKELRNVKVEVTRGGFVRTYIIRSITKESTSKLTFPVDGGATVSVVQYFRDKYNTTLKFPFLQAIQDGTDDKPTYLPMEICRIIDGQRYPKKLNERQVTSMLKATCKRPQVREREIDTVLRGNKYNQDKLVNEEFGMQVREQLTAIEARVLPPPSVRYHASSRQSEVSPSVGQWNMMNLKMFNGGTVNFWAILNFSRQNRDAVDRFCHGIVSMCVDRGMTFNPQPLIPIHSTSAHNIEKALVDVDRLCSTELKKHAPGSSLQLLLIILPEMSGSYGPIKRICETDLGIVSQCCQPKHVMKLSRQYFENVSLKINVKVGGTNAILAKPIPILTARPTIVFGADVTHPQPGEDSGSSIAAVVASMDIYVTKYRALMSAQPHRQEIIKDLKGMVRDHLMAFYRNNNKQKPHRIIFYRDGVSEGQFNEVLLHEMLQIREACVSLQTDYLPPVTFIVVQKRHHTRLFPMNHNDRTSTDRSGNILPGTVVDTQICHPTQFDFYLCSHAGIQGTSRPTHYHVLHDENKFTADGLQMLTNSMCYTYARCTRSVSIVPPAYYAHLTAFRARYYTEGMVGSESESNMRATRERTAEVRALPMICDKVKDVMFYC